LSNAGRGVVATLLRPPRRARLELPRRLLLEERFLAPLFFLAALFPWIGAARTS
jgi:hypothetical protein